jgi:hypothetical protein
MISPPWLNTRSTGALDALPDSTRNAKGKGLLTHDRFADQKLGHQIRQTHHTSCAGTLVGYKLLRCARVHTRMHLSKLQLSLGTPISK